MKDADDQIISCPFSDYAQEPLLSLADACAPLTSIVPDILTYVLIALDGTANNPPDGLTRDESASIRLYTIEWREAGESAYRHLNHALKKNDREKLQPWYKYLKLLLTALVKIPCSKVQIVWRGVRYNSVDKFTKEARITWWCFSSTTESLAVLESDLYLGTTGERTLLSIEVLNGRNIRAHSHFPGEDEILLLPGTLIEVKSLLNPAPDLHIIHLRQLVPEKPLLELPFEDAPLFPKIQSPSKDCVASNEQILPQTLGIRDESVLLGTNLLN
ncbi:unnamed protein product [Rotaria sordida]|uniref:NAD(P)(+)--arginine ADP-ribosyltransferase n=1 Tax=Rotaria sordida TaxID=392033 RepID=A0A814V7H1_9BILA|nr:unnamed protein product [Rotaria sordida]